MSRKDPRIDAYIAKAAPFARPILKTYPQNRARWLPQGRGDYEVEHAAFRLQRAVMRHGSIQTVLLIRILESDALYSLGYD